MNFSPIGYNVKNTGVPSIQMREVRQSFDDSKIGDIGEHLTAALAALPLPPLAGRRIAVTAGSRGIAKITTVTKLIVDFLKDRGANVFIVPAMGSHGGGTAEGQKKVLEEYSITEESMGVPIVSDMSTLFIGDTKSGVKIACGGAAFAADHIVVVNRVKAHSDFKAEYESGLCKMMMVGLGKHVGAATVHKAGSDSFGRLLPEAAEVFIGTGKILFGVALVENANKELAVAECILPRDIIKREKELLVIAKERQSNLYIDGADLLLVDEIGKNISGAGMDPNVTGRPPTGAAGFPAPPAKQIAVLGITPCSGGNAIGIGMSDIISLELARSIEFSSTYTNALTAGVIAAGRIPMIANSEADVILFSMMTLGRSTAEELKIIHIKNTSELKKIEVSENMVNEIEEKRGRINIAEGISPLFLKKTDKIRRLL